MSTHPQLDELVELRHEARALGLAARHRVHSNIAGLYASVFRGQGMDFDEVREYQEGDDIRNMDWRVTARTGKAHLKIFREERGRTVMLCVDVGDHMRFGTRGSFKSVQAARVAALLGWAANDHRDRVGAMLFGDEQRGQMFFSPSQSRSSMWRMLRALTEPVDQPAPGDPSRLLEALEKVNRSAPTGTLVFVIADLHRCRTELEKVLGRLCQRHEVVLVPVDDPSDWQLPAMGTVPFEDPEGQRVWINTDDAQGRQRYTDAWEDQRRSLESRAFRLGIEVIPVRTDEDVHRTLHKGLSRRAARRAVR